MRYGTDCCTVVGSCHRITNDLPGLRHTQSGTVALLFRSIVFLVLAAIVVPVLGISAFMFIGLPLHLIVSSFRMAIAPPKWVDQTLGAILYTQVALIVGAAVGALLNVVRAGDLTGYPDLPRKPGVRTDVFGGAIAAFLAFGGMFIALPLGLFSRPANGPADWLHQLAIPPHLFMTGREMLAGSVARGR